MDINFPLGRAISTEKNDNAMSSKCNALQELGGSAFVDDYLLYFCGTPNDIHRALILREPIGSRNLGIEIGVVDSIHHHRTEFLNQWMRVNKL
jgi:hypothetical protein